MGNYLQEPITEKVKNDFKNSILRAGSCKMQGWRRNMEDALRMEEVAPGISAFAVFDGHGGNEISEFCAKYFIEFLKTTDGFEGQNYDQALKETYAKLEDAIYGGVYDKEIEQLYKKPIGTEDAPDSRTAKDITWASGCTAISCIVTKTHIITANVGDSRCVLGKQEGEDISEEQLSTD
jgi:serine/threonine protein phosphatase PrpC